jgi:hypothetical protein
MSGISYLVRYSELRLRQCMYIPLLSLRALALLGSLFFRRTCYGSVKNGFDSAAILTKIPRMKKEEGLGRRQATKCGAKRQARTCPVTTPQHSNSEGY